MAIPNGRPFRVDGCSEWMANLNGRSFREGPKGDPRGPQGNPRGPRDPLVLFRSHFRVDAKPGAALLQPLQGPKPWTQGGPRGPGTPACSHFGQKGNKHSKLLLFKPRFAYLSSDLPRHAKIRPICPGRPFKQTFRGFLPKTSF